MELPTDPIPPLTFEQLKKINPFLTHETFITNDQVNDFEQLLKEKAGETELDKFLTHNPEVFSAALHDFQTGHHGAIVIPKQVLRPRLQEKGLKGLIPDFIVGGDSSDGWEWWVVEIKGSDQSIFAQTNNDLYFSSEVNKGICQLLEYIDFCSEHQGMIRDLFKLEDFREPKGLLIVGQESEVSSNEQKKKLKAAWNRIAKDKLGIRTFDFIRRNLRPIYDFHSKGG